MALGVTRASDPSIPVDGPPYHCSIGYASPKKGETPGEGNARRRSRGVTNVTPPDLQARSQLLGYLLFRLTPALSGVQPTPKRR